MKAEDYEKMFHLALRQEGKLLKGYTNFHRYSLGNQLWAMCQMHFAGVEISPIATYKKWAELGRQVQKGSKAVALYMPVTVDDDKNEGKKKTIFVMRRMWFAMSQTEGEDNSEKLNEYLGNTDFDYEKALRELGIVKEAFNEVNGNVQGYAKKGIVAVNPLAELPTKTLFHEIAHNLLHLENDEEFVDDKTSKHNLQEVEAEGTALFVSLALGLQENVPYCVGYVKSWLGEGNEIPVDSIKKIFRCADKILKAGQGKAEEGK